MSPTHMARCGPQLLLAIGDTCYNLQWLRQSANLGLKIKVSGRRLLPFVLDLYLQWLRQSANLGLKIKVSGRGLSSFVLEC